MKILKLIITLLIVSNSFAYYQMFGTSGKLKFDGKKVISIWVTNDRVQATTTDKNGRDTSYTLFQFDKKYEKYKEFFLDTFEKGAFDIYPNRSGKIEDLYIKYKGRKQKFLDVAIVLAVKDECGLGMSCRKSDRSQAAINDGRRTTTPGTVGPLKRREAKEDPMSRINF